MDARSDVGEAAGRSDEGRVEQHLLRFSVYCGGYFTMLGLVWGVLAKSQMIIFDGLYSFVSVFLSSLSVFAAWSMTHRDDARFPLGRAALEPLVVALKSMVIIVLCLAAFGKAAISLLSGGQEINALSAVGYGFVGTFSCLGGLLYIVWKRKRAGVSSLVKAECMQWGMDTLLSAAVMLGFLAALLLERAGYARQAVYVDPLMVLVASALFIKMPVASLVEGVKDMLRMAPDGDVYRFSRQVLEEVAREHGFAGFSLRISRSGRQFAYKIGLVTDDPRDTRTLAELDGIRQDVEDRFKARHDNPMRLVIGFMHDRKWG